MKESFLRKNSLNVLKLLLIISIPVFLFLLNLYFLVTKEFVTLLYNTIPESYRFTKDERILYSGLIIDYLKFNADISTIENLEDDNTKIFTQKEITHLKDVRLLLLNALKTHLLSAVGIVSSTFILKRERIPIRKYFMVGGLITILVIFIVNLFTLLDFNLLFIYFHQVFFIEGSYTFLQSDTLIQLFPLEFWINSTFIFITLTVFKVVMLVLAILKAKEIKEKLNKLI